MTGVPPLRRRIDGLQEHSRPIQVYRSETTWIVGRDLAAQFREQGFDVTVTPREPPQTPDEVATTPALVAFDELLAWWTDDAPTARFFDLEVVAPGAAPPEDAIHLKTVDGAAVFVRREDAITNPVRPRSVAEQSDRSILTSVDRRVVGGGPDADLVVVRH